MIIAIDFDGTICKDDYPDCGELMVGVKEVLDLFKEENNYLILHTCRQGELLLDAINFCLEHKLPIDRVNSGNPRNVRKYGGEGRKIYADMYIDDKNFGGFPGWEAIRLKYLEEYGLYSP
ncbi:MAG: hypothetical protein R3Y59_02835 [bacterium]